MPPTTLNSEEPVMSVNMHGVLQAHFLFLMHMQVLSSASDLQLQFARQVHSHLQNEHS